ncbi:MAG: hypothetical protein K5945_04540 [Bacteroidaceae bacterium]|nr:hypothetical protein [Bacteroidaceae bacterium]
MRRLAFALALLTVSVGASSQMWEQLATSDYRLDNANLRTLRVALDNLSFFRDNENSSSLTKGYSLPGLWLQPKLVCMPIERVELEVGVHALIFDGANKYPNYVYHDIGRWKGAQYQRGAHALPWFRARAGFRHLTVVMGDIYGGQQHGFIAPLFNAETNLSQDPEMGFQLLWDRPHLHADTWLNWQSYIFEEDSHQEAFTVGSNWRVLYNDASAELHWYSPIQLVIQHRGGEQDTTALGVQTLSNASLGIGLRRNMSQGAFHHVGAEANLLATYQQSGHQWPFDSGWAVHADAEAAMRCGIGLHAGLFHAPRHFASLYGNHFFSTISVREDASYKGITTAYLRADYHYTFARDYVLGAEAEGYQSWLGHSATQKRSQEFNFSFGIYLRIHPDILLKKW